MQINSSSSRCVTHQSPNAKVCWLNDNKSPDIWCYSWTFIDSKSISCAQQSSTNCRICIDCQIIQYRGKFQDWPSDVECRFLVGTGILVMKLCQNMSRSEGCYLSLLENNYLGNELRYTWANHLQCQIWYI